MHDSSNGPSQRRRRVPLVFLAGAVAATLLIFGVSGTLSSWTAAIISNNNNSVASTGSVALLETQTAPVNASAVACDTASSATNSVSCTSINSYGGIGSTNTTNGDDAYGAALNPDAVNSQAVTVNLKNHGGGQGTLALSAGACSNLAYPGAVGADPADYNLCTQMLMAVTCTAPGTLAYSGTVAAFTGGSVGTIAAGDSSNCKFTMTLPAATPAGYASQYLTQALTWTLTAAP